MIIKRLVVSPLAANCYLVGAAGGREGLVIDPGGQAGDILRAAAEAGLAIASIVLTHGHSDHIAALRDIRDATGAAVAIHAADAGFLRGRGPRSMMFGISYKTPAPPDRVLRDGDTIDGGGARFTVVHTPGHTPGSICLLAGDKIFTGDTLFYHGIGTTMMPGSSRRQLLESVRERLMALPDDTTIYPGHGRQTTIGAERRGNPFLQH